MPSLCFIPKCCHGDTSLGCRDTGSGLLAGDIPRGAAAAWSLGDTGTQEPDTFELWSAWSPSFLATWLLWANSCPCAALSRESVWQFTTGLLLERQRGCIILGKAYLSHLPRSTSFPSLSPPPTPSPSLLPSSFTLSGGFSILCAFFFCLSPFFLVKTGLSLWVEKGSVFVECSCISKVLCWPVMNLPLLMWGNREML